MIDLRGTVVGPISDRGFSALRRAGVLPSDFLELLPGAVNSKKWRRWYLPANVLPASPRRHPPRRKLRSGLQLRAYQAEGSAFIDDSVQGCLINFDVGVGKTLTVLDYLDRHPELRPFLVVGVVPAQGSWLGREADPWKHCRMRVDLLEGRRAAELPAGNPDGYFINYAVVSAWRQVVIQNMRPKVLVLDEAHEVRNPRRADAKALVAISSKTPGLTKRIAMSATAVVNGLQDLWMILELVQPGMWGPWVTHPGYTTSFCARYNGAHLGEYGWIQEGPSNEDELRYRLRGVAIRKERMDVMSELPPFERQVVQLPRDALDPGCYTAYKKSENEMRGGGRLSAAPLQRLAAMGALLSASKRAFAAKEALNLVRSAKKIVVFCWYKDTAAHIAKVLEGNNLAVFGPVTGETPFAKRLALAEAFRDETHAGAYVATLGAAGVALNPLSAASVGLFVDLFWVPATLLQAEGRLHREGQRAAKVLFRYLVAAGSIDTIMFAHLQRKARAIVTTGDATARSLIEDLGGQDEGGGMKALLDALEGLDAEALELQ